MLSLNDVVTAVCSLPIDFQRGKVSAIELVRRSGYLTVRREVTVEHLNEYLATNPKLVDAWIQWSEDNRSTPAWCIRTLGPHAFEVGYIDRTGRTSQRLRINDKVLACAEFVHHDLEQLADFAEMSPWAVIRHLLRRPRSS